MSHMNADPLTVEELLEQPFTIHSLNNYAHMGLTNLVDHLELSPVHLQRIIRAAHFNLVTELEREGIHYSELGNALVPRSGRHEAAFIFDSTRAANGLYGYSFAEKWIPVVTRYGPEKSVLRVGDILGLPSEYVWQQIERHLVGPPDFPRIARELYFAVYITNLSSAQLAKIDSELAATTSAYLGYVDCTTWNPLKAGMYLPQVGLRIRDYMITDTGLLRFWLSPGFMPPEQRHPSLWSRTRPVLASRADAASVSGDTSPRSTTQSRGAAPAGSATNTDRARSSGAARRNSPWPRCQNFNRLIWADFWLLSCLVLFGVRACRGVVDEVV